MALEIGEHFNVTEADVGITFRVRDLSFETVGTYFEAVLCADLYAEQI